MTEEHTTIDPETIKTYSAARDNLARLVLVAETASEPWKGRTPDHRRRLSGDLLFQQITLRANSILKLAPAVQSVSDEQPFPIDVLSVHTLVRAMLEGYLTLFYLAVEDVDQSEREFRFLAWDFCGESIRIKGLRSSHPDHSKLPGLKANRAKYEAAFKAHSRYGELNTNVAKQVEQGRDGLLIPRPGIALSAGISPGHYHSIYKHASDYSHGGALAEAQFQGFCTDAEAQLRMTTGALMSADAILSFVITDYQT